MSMLAIHLAVNTAYWRFLQLGHVIDSEVARCCIDFDISRQNFYTASNLKDLFHNIHPKRIISFVYAIGLTNKL